jgi:hypothetical protein
MTMILWPGSTTVGSSSRRRSSEVPFPRSRASRSEPLIRIIPSALWLERGWTDAHLMGMHELDLTLTRGAEGDANLLSILASLPQYPVLRKLKLNVQVRHRRHEDDDNDGAVSWPPFIPPSLRVLHVALCGKRLLNESMIRALPRMLEASGARLEELDISSFKGVEEVGTGLAPLGPILRACSPTLETFRLSMYGRPARDSFYEEEFADLPQAEEPWDLCEQWAEVGDGCARAKGCECSSFPTWMAWTRPSRPAPPAGPA